MHVYLSLSFTSQQLTKLLNLSILIVTFFLGGVLDGLNLGGKKCYIILWLTLFSRSWVNSHPSIKFRRAILGWEKGVIKREEQSMSLSDTLPWVITQWNCNFYFSIVIFLGPWILQTYTTILTNFACTFSQSNQEQNTISKYILTKLVINKDNMITLPTVFNSFTL